MPDANKKWYLRRKYLKRVSVLISMASVSVNFDKIGVCSTCGAYHSCRLLALYIP